MIMTGKTSLYLGAAAALSTTVAVGYFAMAQDGQGPYVEGENVYVCPTVLDKNRFFDCRVAGERTPRFKQLPFIDNETGERFLKTVHAYFPVNCGQYGCAVINNWDGFKQGTLVGQGVYGRYLMDSGWYLDFDSSGKTTAYRSDVGPQQGHALYTKSSSNHASGYGTEACFDAMVTEIQEENPNFPISFDMMNEMRAECGLPPEE